MTERLLTPGVLSWWVTVRVLHAAISTLLLPLAGPIRPFPSKEATCAAA